MCPPAPVPPPADISVYWSDEEIFRYLEKITCGSPLPSNVFADVNPYQYIPSNLPDDVWYFIRLEEKKDTELGFWKAKGEACEIFMDSDITGWRTTLEFYEGQAPHGRQTDWVMQEYRITRKRLCENKQPKVKNRDDTIGPLTVAESLQNLPVENLHENDYILRGDYLALDDLSSSSDNSSRVSLSSDECFDSLALLRDLEDEINQNQQGKDANFQFSVSASARSNEVVMNPATLGSLISSNASKSPTEEPPKSGCSRPALAIEGKYPEKRALKHEIKTQKADNKKESTSNYHNVAASSSSHKAASEGRMKRLKTYLCFMPF